MASRRSWAWKAPPGASGTGSGSACTARRGTSRSWPTGSFVAMESHRPGITDFVHIGLVVEDLDETVRFLEVLGLDCGKPGVFGGEWIDRIIGLGNAEVEVVMA